MENEWHLTQEEFQIATDAEKDNCYFQQSGTFWLTQAKRIFSTHQTEPRSGKEK